MKKLQNNIYFKFNFFQKKIDSLEEKISILDKKIDDLTRLENIKLMRVKNKEELSDEYLLENYPYYDLSPQSAFKYYKNNDKDFILLDVSKKEFDSPNYFEEAIKIPLEELQFRFDEINNKKVSVLVISEDGVRSILACELLYTLGFNNINNISGGYKFWPESKNREQSDSQAS